MVTTGLVLPAAIESVAVPVSLPSLTVSFALKRPALA